MDNKTFYTRWAIGIWAMVTWYWGGKLGAPESAVSLGAWVVSGLLGHAIGISQAGQTAQPTKPEPAAEPAITEGVAQ